MRCSRLATVKENPIHYILLKWGAAMLRPYATNGLTRKREQQQIAFAWGDHRELAVRRDREITKCQAV
jgi:hypothetical protein